MHLVTFIAKLSEDTSGYAGMAAMLQESLSQMPGFIAFHPVQQDGTEIAVSIWENLESIKAWKEDPLHEMAQKKGKEKWLESYEVYISKVERHYSFDSI